MDDATVPDWLWRLVVGGFVGLVLVIGALAAALAMGAADPHPLGTLAWETNFDLGADSGDWNIAATPGIVPTFSPNGSTIELAEPGDQVAVTRPNHTSTYTFEAAGAQVGGAPGAIYGIVFDYRTEDEYSAVVLNNNGFVTAYRQRAAGREAWFAWQQWPHILLAAEFNRLRVDVQAGQGEIRINEEVLLTVPTDGTGNIGVIATAQAEAQSVTFAWARLWTP